MKTPSADDIFETLWDSLASEGVLPPKEATTESGATVPSPIRTGRQAKSDAKPGTLLHEIGQLSSRLKKTVEEEKKFQALQSLFLEKFPDMREKMDTRIRNGVSFGELKNLAYHCGAENKPFAVVMKDTRYGELNGYEQNVLRNQHGQGMKARRRGEEERKARKSGQPLSKVQPRAFARGVTSVGGHRGLEMKAPLAPVAATHPNDIRSLAPAAKWTLVVDESGQTFDASPESALSHKIAGRFVGLLVPEDALPGLKQEWHAVRESNGEIDRVVQQVLDAPVGVFGVEVASVPYSPGDRWFDGVALVIDWVLRLMPVEGPTELEVLIEQRGEFNRNQPWDVVRRMCLYRLAMELPGRATRVNLSIRAIRKGESPLNGYADALAFTWAKTSQSSKERLKRSGLSHTCLLSATNGFDARRMLTACETFAQGANLEAGVWWEWVVHPSASDPATLLHGFLSALGAECRDNPLLWQSFLSEVKRRMGLTPVDLPALAAAVEWLRGCQPESERLPPMAEMAWLTVRHARANHEGKIETEHAGRLTELESALFDEAAPLVCHAQLHRAVMHCNRFEFPEGRKLLLPWLNRPAAVPGLRYHAHVLSSLGQLAAFEGQYEEAKEFLQKALAGINRMSDRTQAMLDDAQTRAYLAIVLMDDPNEEDPASRDQLEKVVGPLQKVGALSCSKDPSRRYSLHLLMRWLCARGDDETEDLVRACMDKWEVGEGHPWPLIQLYRGLLMAERDRDVALQLFEDGALLADAGEPGPTVAFIGACIRNVASAHGVEWPDRENVVIRLSRELPAASGRIQLLATPPQPDRQAVMKFLSQALPFNFH